MADPRTVAIVTIHGNSRRYGGAYASRYAWPRLQISQLRRYTPKGFSVLAYGHRLSEEHADFLRSCPEVTYLTDAPVECPQGHVWPLRNWIVARACENFRHIVMLDSDAFPVAYGWLDRYVDALSDERPLAAVQRLENTDTHSDRCFVVFSRDTWREHELNFTSEGVVDAGARISEMLERKGLDWHRLNRTNLWNPHPLIAGVYDGSIYHHSAGTRAPFFRMNQSLRPEGRDTVEFRRERIMHVALTHEIHADTDRFIDRLIGRKPPLQRRRLMNNGRALMAEFGLD